MILALMWLLIVVWAVAMLSGIVLSGYIHLLLFLAFGLGVFDMYQHFKEQP